MRDYWVTDPEFAERLEHFAYDEVVKEEGQQLDDTTRYMAILATLLGCQGREEFALQLVRALDLHRWRQRRSFTRRWTIWGSAEYGRFWTSQMKC